jgi:polyhydroxyalkanoate synthesis regulator phasin
VKLSKTFVIPVAGLLVVLGAGAVLASTGSSPTTGGSAVMPAAESPSPGASGAPKREFQDPALTSVLDDLVAKGTITAAQRQAILDGLKAERAQRLADAKARREALRAQAEKIKGFLADGQITQDELDQLPADSPLRQLTNLMDDGKITTDELQSIGRGLLGNGGFRGFGRGHGFGWGFGHDGVRPDASPAPSASPASGG